MATKTINKIISIKNPTNGVLNGDIDQYLNKTKSQLINEIITLKEKVKYFEELHSKREIRQEKCISELKELINNK